LLGICKFDLSGIRFQTSFGGGNPNFSDFHHQMRFGIWNMRQCTFGIPSGGKSSIPLQILVKKFRIWNSISDSVTPYRTQGKSSSICKCKNGPRLKKYTTEGSSVYKCNLNSCKLKKAYSIHSARGWRCLNIRIRGYDFLTLIMYVSSAAGHQPNSHLKKLMPCCGGWVGSHRAGLAEWDGLWTVANSPILLRQSEPTHNSITTLLKNFKKAQQFWRPLCGTETWK
jgi:hypothetical protein